MRFNHEGVVGELTTLPGCSQIVVSHGVFVRPEDRNKGKGFSSMSARINTMKTLGYDYSLCTVESSNIPERKILTKSNWREFDRFISTKTEHEVILFGKKL